MCYLFWFTHYQDICTCCIRTVTLQSKRPSSHKIKDLLLKILIITTIYSYCSLLLGYKPDLSINIHKVTNNLIFKVGQLETHLGSPHKKRAMLLYYDIQLTYISIKEPNKYQQFHLNKNEM